VIAYILGTFPQPSQTFIAREVRGLLALRMPLQVFALRRKDPSALEPADREWFPRVRFAPLALSPRSCGAVLHFLRREPRRLARAAARLTMLPHRPRLLVFRAWLLLFKAAWIAREIEQSGGCDQVHAHFALAQTEVAMAVAMLLDRPFSFTAHARDIYATPSALEEKMRAAALVVTCTACNVEFLERLVPDLPPGRIQLVHHGVAMRDADERPDSSNPEPGAPVVLAAGRLIEKKGFDVLIEACALLRRRNCAFQCWILGDGPLRGRLARLTAHAGLEAHVTFRGWQPAQAVAAAMRSSALLAVPSRVNRGDRDGIPNVMLEAMSAGRPVVATTVSGIPEAVGHGTTGLLVPPGDAAALADAIELLVRDPERARAMGAAGRVRAMRDFELTASSRRLATLFGFFDRETRPNAAIT
jgi:glycosyltransferase involved in cell wall biosynthesis